MLSLAAAPALEISPGCFTRAPGKIKLEEVKAFRSSNFEQDRKLFHTLEMEDLTKEFDNGPLFKISTCPTN